MKATPNKHRRIPRGRLYEKICITHLLQTQSIYQVCVREAFTLRKNRYYVGLHSGEISGEILQQQGSSPYQFEIEATKEEVQELNALLSKYSLEDTDTFWTAHIPYQNKLQSEQNKDSDQSLRGIYHMIYRLGTSKTKQQIRDLQVLKPPQL